MALRGYAFCFKVNHQTENYIKLKYKPIENHGHHPHVVTQVVYGLQHTIFCNCEACKSFMPQFLGDSFDSLLFASKALTLYSDSRFRKQKKGKWKWKNCFPHKKRFISLCKDKRHPMFGEGITKHWMAQSLVRGGSQNTSDNSQKTTNKGGGRELVCYDMLSGGDATWASTCPIKQEGTKENIISPQRYQIRRVAQGIRAPDVATVKALFSEMLLPPWPPAEAMRIRGEKTTEQGRDLMNKALVCIPCTVPSL